MVKTEDLAVKQIVSRDTEVVEGKPDVRHADDALAFVTGHESVVWTAEEERKVLRKIDCVILPLVHLPCWRSPPTASSF